MNRVADNSLAKKLLGWEPQTRFMDGLHAAIDWYYSTKDRDRVAQTLERKLIER
jgi:nucleoside-diphosphate-sugar epimerase